MPCQSPFRKSDSPELFPCGKCPDCTSRRISGWSFRLLQEEQQCYSALFLTLSYDTDHVPITPNNFMSLRKSDISDFMKKLRKLHSRKLKYYCAGEYGSQKKRPHYHMILFNANAKFIEQCWPHGSVYFGDVRAGSVGYTLKYISKPRNVPEHNRDDRQRESSQMSKGLGRSYLTPQMVNWHKADLVNRMHLNIEDGKKIAMPRYYKLKMYSDEEKTQINDHIFEKFNEEAVKLAENPQKFSDKREAIKQAFNHAVKKSKRNDSF